MPAAKSLWRDLGFVIAFPTMLVCWITLHTDMRLVRASAGGHTHRDMPQLAGALKWFFNMVGRK